MGLDTSSIMLLCAAKSLGVNFEHTAMIGRQSFWPDRAMLQRVFAILGIEGDAKSFLQQHKYAEEFLRLLGAKRIESVDVSPYENASILHDFNLPIPLSLKERFTLVHDGGTIEHVFNISQAFKNCMEMVRVGGHFTQVNVANNFTGHGFWQFSPELIFRMFSPQNGFQLEAVLMHEVIRGGRWYVVSDPDHIHQRVELRNNQPTYILTIAKRIANVPVFANTPQQSDYVDLWDQTLNQSSPPLPKATNGNHGATWRRHVPEPLKWLVRTTIDYLQSAKSESTSHGFRQPGYRHITEEELLHGRLPTGRTV